MTKNINLKNLIYKRPSIAGLVKQLGITKTMHITEGCLIREKSNNKIHIHKGSNCCKYGEQRLNQMSL